MATVMTTQPIAGTTVFVQAIQLSDSPQRMNCPHCQQDIVTVVKHENGMFTHVLAGVLCVVGCWPCCLIPYCVDSAKDTEHVCPNCQRFIGMRKRL